MSQPFTLPTAAAATGDATGSSSLLPAGLFGLWLCGLAVSAFVWIRYWLAFRAGLRAATALNLNLPVPVMISPARLEPGVFGIARPILLLPEGILNRLTPEQLRAILAHELCHVRRRDNLTAAMHMLVESIFWFHPLVWWIGRKLVDEREQACDEEVVQMGNEPHAYAEGILNVCRFYLQSPLACAPGVTGADLKRRIEGIVSMRMSTGLTATRKMLLAMAGMAVIATPVLIGWSRAPSAHAQSQGKLFFEVASIRRLVANEGGGGAMPLAPGVTAGGGIRSQVPIFNLICWAYQIDGSQLSGGPGWLRSDRYAIQAKPREVEGPDDPAARLSARERQDQTRERVKALLADRFRLVVRTETREAPVYVLLVAKGGPKLPPPTNGEQGGIRFLGDAIESNGAPVSFLAVTLTQMLGRPVLDQTGLDGRYKYKLDFRPENLEIERALAQEGKAVDGTPPSIFTAIRSQLGLELQSRKGPLPTVVIEGVERPTEN